MNILSLDASSKSTGWAYFEDNKMIEYGCIKSSSKDVIKRIYIMRDEIDRILKEKKVDKIILEEVRPDNGRGVSNSHVLKVLLWLQAAIAFLVYDNYKGIEIEYVYPSSWRAALGIKNGRGIKRTALKQEDIDYVRKKYKIETNDDEADAICIGEAWYSSIDNEINWE